MVSHIFFCGVAGGLVVFTEVGCESQVDSYPKQLMKRLVAWVLGAASQVKFFKHPSKQLIRPFGFLCVVLPRIPGISVCGVS